MKQLAHLTRSLALVGTLSVSATTANAAPMLFTLGGEEYSDLSASVLFSYAGLTATTARVEVAVTNTSSQWDPRLTGIAFNLPGAITGVSSFTSSLSGWSSSHDPNDIDTPGQFGLYDVAALSGRKFSRGSSSHGIARNATATFAFNLNGAGMLGLSETSFLNLLSYDAPGKTDEDAQYFIAHFQRVGFLGRDSDVATPNGPPSTPLTHGVPEPTTLLLSGLGLLGLAAMRQKA
jgi:hypothetical protein